MTCGGTEADCAPGTCYEGACPGDRIWSTDATCGPSHGGRHCAGVWGDCCSLRGVRHRRRLLRHGQLLFG